MIAGFGLVWDCAWKAAKCEVRKSEKEERNRREKQFEDNFVIAIGSAIAPI